MPSSPIEETKADGGSGDGTADGKQKTVESELWSCHMCSYQNPLSENAGACQICFTQRVSTAESSATANGDGRNEWSCTKCTFLNEMKATNCAVCKEGKALPLVGKDKSLWHCPQCTFGNQIHAVQCEICLHKRDSGDGAGATAGAATSINQRPSTMTAASTEPPMLLPVRQESEFMEALRAIDEAEANEQYRTILQFCQQNRQPFVDDSFPPTDLSLRRSQDSQKRQLPPVHWRRPARINNFLERLMFPWTVCSSPIPSDIVQGILGNCWFLSALAVVAERPDLLDHILVTKRINQEGVYQIRLCIDGQWRIIVVDDLFPCAPNGAMIYSKAKRNQLWVPLIEKALAKAYGSYESLTAGRTVEGLAVLTGAPCEALQVPGHGRQGQQDADADADVVWAKLLSMKEAKFLLGASCGGDKDGGQVEYHLVGLEPLHAYSLLDAREVNGARLVKLRNPWGHFAWNGAWSEHSSLWTPQLRAELMPEGFRDGIFWMPYEDFCRYFDSIDVCRYRSDWRELRFTGLLPPHCRPNYVYVAELAAAEATEIDIALYQPNVRNEKPSKHGVLDLAVLMFSVDQFGRPSRLVARSDHAVRSFVTLSSVIQPGQYIVVWVSFNHWGMRLVDAEIPKCVVAIHSARAVTAQVRSVNPILLADCLIQLFSQDARTASTDLPGVNVCYLTRKWTGVAVMVANYNKDAILNIHCDCSESQNAVSTRESLVTVDAVPPMHRQILMILTQVEGSSASSFCYRVQYTLNPTVRPLRPYQDVMNYANRILSFLGNNQAQIGTDQTQQQPQPPAFPTNSHTPDLTVNVYGVHAPRPIV